MGKGVWTEEQEDELRNLFLENQSNPSTDKDVIDWILENLIDQTRTRRGVIKKLKDLGLIFKAPTKRSNKERLAGRVSKEFSEEEDSMLIELWKQFVDSADPMGLIIPRMPRKRPRRSFVERLLELDLIQDKKQCRKRKQTKSKSQGNEDNDTSGGNSSVSESSDESRSDSNIKVQTPQKTKKILKKVKGKPETRANTKSAKSIELSASEIAKMLVQVVESGHTEALRWLAENLEEVALDQEAEGYDPSAEDTPLVPISEDSVKAMESSLFRKVLKGVGISPPADEQEMYWRIPSRLHWETIRKRREIILKAVNKELIIDNTGISAIVIPEEEEEDHHKNKKSSDDDDDLFDSLRKLRDIKYYDIESRSSKSTSRKRSRSADEGDSKRGKMQKFEEEKIDNEDDVLSFAKKTLQCDEPNTEDILSNIPSNNIDDSDNENDELVLPKKRKKTRVLIDDDSD